MKLNGDRNQCQGCKHYFNSSFAFDKHRVGTYGADRRCMTTDEMEQKGMGINYAGFWVSSLMDSAKNGFTRNGDVSAVGDVNEPVSSLDGETFHHTPEVV